MPDPLRPTPTREVHLARRPVGEPTPDDFAVVDVELPPPAPGQVLVRTTWMSVEPYMRGRMDDRPSYIAPFALGAPLEGGAVGEVVASRSAAVPVGATVSHFRGWREHAVLDEAAVEVVDGADVPSHAYLGPLGTPGLTAHVALSRIAPVAPGDVVYVSAAGGAVGNVAAAVARHLGASLVIGSAGGPAKTKVLTEVFGYDVGLDRHGDLAAGLAAAAPDGIDVYVDSVGGSTLELAIAALRPRGRVALVGAVAQYNDTTPRPGPTNLYEATKKEISLRGVLVTSHQDLMAAHRDLVRPWLVDGTLRTQETVVEGLERAPQALIDLLRGGVVGKMLVRVDR
ncbi:NADP-dependent oxidoreductase [Iamia sp. SCSIO 61187]|uniref:NADP-dependent oxidoreductase n=1 Tax=Iamia sp. SCSIO 61187 TaxID=2722752 RepID=UPI001C631318|nr:NADP-dependent oxidoreductase [Iamia sp. SCSIO 61187]QYG95040.1 NADP-dependent oxidoreductase [Iamia sp. SCSIO 61187]